MPLRIAHQADRTTVGPTRWGLSRFLLIGTAGLLGVVAFCNASTWCSGLRPEGGPSSCVASEVPPTAPGLRWSVRTHPGMIAGLTRLDFAHRRSSPLEVARLLQQSSFDQQVEDFLDLCVGKGISEIIIDGVQPELKGIYLRSEKLESLGWQPLTDVLGVLSRKAGARKLQIGVNLAELGIHARGLYEGQYGLAKIPPLSRADLGAVFRELVHRYSLYTVTEEDFPAEWYSVMRELSRELGFRYVHRANCDDIVSLASAHPRTTPLEAFGDLSALCTKDYTPLTRAGQENGVANGSLPLLLGRQQRLVEISAWDSSPLFLRAASYFRALEAGPEEVTLLLAPCELTTLGSDFFARVSDLRRSYDPALPMLNLIVAGTPRQRLDPGHAAWLHLVANLEPIVLGAEAAGLRPFISREPRGDAAAYYLYLAGASWEEWNALEPFLMEIRDKPIIVQCAAALPGPVFQRLTNFLGLGQNAWYEGLMPPFGFFKGQNVSFKGQDLYEGKVPTGHIQFRAEPAHAPMMDLARTPLLYHHRRIPNRFLVNGGLLHREMAYPISQVLAGGRGLQKPSACFIAMGKKTAFWALEDTEVDWVNPRTGEGVRLEMKANGFYVK